MSDNFNAKMKLLMKSEKALLSLDIRKKSRQAVLVAIALLAVLAGLVMLNVTVYLYLGTHYSNLASAAILSGLNLLVAIIFFFIASRQDRGADAESIEEIRNFAWGQIETDIDEVKQNVSKFTQSVNKVKSSVDSFTSGDAFGLNKILPVITTLIDLDKKK
jgi:hypothetical protein